MAKPRILLITLVLSLALTGGAATVKAAPAPDAMATDARSELLVSIAEVAGGIDLAGRPGVDFLQVDGSKVEAFVRSLAYGSPQRSRTRVFVQGHPVSEDGGSFQTVNREKGFYQPASGSLFVVGTRDGDVVIEDIRFLEVDGTVFVLRDIHLEASAAAVDAARGLPVLLVASSKALAPPQIISLGGVSSSAAGISNGRVSMSCGTTWNGRMVINDQAGVYPWTINGFNFMSTRGTVAIAGQSVPISSWSSARIVINPTSSVNSLPQASTTLKVAASSGTATYAVSTAPSIRTRIFGQCTHYVAAQRLAMGLQPSPTAYGGYTSIGAQWVPRRGDQLQWSGRHTAIITAVSGPASGAGGYKTYTITIGERNADCRHTIRSYTTEFQTRTLNGVTTVTKFPKSSVTSLGSATTYYR